MTAKPVLQDRREGRSVTYLEKKKNQSKYLPAHSTSFLEARKNGGIPSEFLQKVYNLGSTGGLIISQE